MRIFSVKTILLSFAVLLLVCGLSLDVSAQKKRKKKAAQPLPMPTPVQTTTGSTEPVVVGRATDYADLEDYFPKTTTIPAAGDNQTAADTQNTVPTPSPELEELARQVRALSGRIDSMDAKQKLLLDLEILGRAEQRSENLRKQLMDSTDKEAGIKSRLIELEGEMRPEAIERKAAFVGSLRPEEVRENMRKSLQAEKDRLTNQLSQIQNSRAALETSLQNADNLAEKLRLKLEKEIDEQAVETPAKTPAKKPE